jgi:hypothetical protein
MNGSEGGLEEYEGGRSVEERSVEERGVEYGEGKSEY